MFIMFVDIEGYNGKYKIDPNGSILNTKTNKLLKTNTNWFGYTMVILFKEGKPKRVRLHRLLAIHFIKNPKPESFNIVNHKDGNPSNNQLDNLEWCDQKHNIKQAYLLGRKEAPKNMLGKKVGLTSKFNNVYFCNTKKAWIANVEVIKEGVLFKKRKQFSLIKYPKNGELLAAQAVNKLIDEHSLVGKVKNTFNSKELKYLEEQNSDDVKR